jgi:transcriptional regulator with XRE-family HTH domain
MAVSKVFSKIKAVWSMLSDKEARDEYVAARIDGDVAYQIYSLRKQNNWTQAELAARYGIENGQGAICRWERTADGISVKALRRLASAFDVGLSIKFVPFSQLVDDASTERLDREIPSFAVDKIPSKFAPLFATIGVASTGSRFNLAPPSTPWQHATLAAPSQPLIQENVRAN